MKRITALLALTAVIAFTNQANSQAMGSSYKTAIGFKFSPTAVTIKHFVKPNAAIEGLGYFWKDGFRVTGLYEWHGNFASAAGLKWYVGGGAHLDVYNDDYKNSSRYSESDNVGLGLDGVLGLDYKFNKAPINISLDWQPSVTFVGYNYNNVGWGGMAIRFAF